MDRVQGFLGKQNSHAFLITGLDTQNNFKMLEFSK